MRIHRRDSSTTTSASSSSPVLGARLLAGALLAASCLAGCAKSTAPVTWLPRAVDAQKTAHGGWVSLHTLGSPRRTMREGELLAIQSDSVFILEGSCVGIPISQIERGTLMGYDPESRRLALWTLGGTLSTGSHGAILLLTAPAWLIVGTAATASQSHASEIVLKPVNLNRARAYARFPQGFPPRLDRSSLREK